MLRTEMTRKEFLRAMGAFLGLFILSRLPFGGAAKSRITHSPGSYGNNPYGGKQ